MMGLFADRDGVINEVLSHRVKFVNQETDFYLLEGVREAIKLFNDHQWKVFVVTNQGDIGLGYMTKASLNKIHDKMKKELNKHGAHIDDIAFCAHKPHAQCPCRKPHSKMIVDLAEKHKINLPKSFMVGDREIDIKAGKNASTQTVLVGERFGNIKADYYFPNLITFANWMFN